jgi:hypothetical protein
MYRQVNEKLERITGRIAIYPAHRNGQGDLRLALRHS